MKVSDAICGAIFLALAAAVFVYAIYLPPMPGQRYGAGTFPVVIALGMGLFSLILIVQDVRRHVPGTGWVEVAAWARDRRTLGNFALALVLILVYVFASERVGFIPLSIAILLILFLKQGVSWRTGLVVAVAATLAIQISFSDLLRVPLPRGILTRSCGDAMELILKAIGLIADPYVLAVIGFAAAFGLFVGAMPGLTATMATALLVPITFFMPPVPALAAIVTASAMAIFAGDIPGALLRIPGTPASAAYTDEAYAMTKKGKAELALGAGVVFSAIGGIFGTIVLVTAAPLLAEVALRFSSFEYFWLVCLGLTCAVFIAQSQPVKGMIALFFGLFVASIGLENPAGTPRFTFGTVDLMGGIEMIPAMVGMFAIAEVLRALTASGAHYAPPQPVTGSIFKGQWGLMKKYPVQVLRGSSIGTLIGALPGAGADIASWITYATSKRFSKEPEKFGTGHVEGIVESGAANNAAVSGAWIPALVFGIPGDSITAIVIGVLYLKNLIPGPLIFEKQPEIVTALFVVFFLANIIMIPFGWLAIKAAKHILSVPRELLMPMVMMFCIVGAFAITNSPFAVAVMLVFGMLGFLMEEHGFPVAPVILGIVLGPMLEQSFVTSMIKSDGSFLAFFARPIAGVLGVVTLLVWAAMLWRGFRAWRMGSPAGAATL